MATASHVDFSRLKVLSILEGPGAAVLTFILKRGTNSPSPSVPLDRYLNTLPLTSSANFGKLCSKDRRKVFTNIERRQISSDPSWDRFDVSLLYKAIRHGCENLANLHDTVGWNDMTSLEGLITKVKNERNIFVHEKPQQTDIEFEAKVSELQNLFFEVLQAAQTKYHVPEGEIINEKSNVEKGVKDILKCFTAKEFLHLDSIKMLHVFKNIILTSLSSTYESAQTFDPHSKHF